MSINDADAANWWRDNFDEASTVSNKLLTDRLAQEFRDTDSGVIRAVVNHVIDLNWDNEVTKSDFANFVDRFGPFVDVTAKEHNPVMRAAVDLLQENTNEPQPWYYGKVESDVVMKQLRNKSNTYIIQLSDSHPDKVMLSLSKTKAGRLVVKNVLIVNKYPNWTIAGGDGSEFVSLNQLLRENGDCLFPPEEERKYEPAAEEKFDGGSAYGSVGGSAYASVSGGAYADVSGGSSSSSSSSSSTYANVGGGGSSGGSAYANVGGGGGSAYANVGGGSAYANVGGSAYADVSGGGGGNSNYADVSGGSAYADVSGGSAYADVSGGSGGNSNYADLSNLGKKK